MNFFQAQDSARRSTTNLVVFFFLAVLSLIVFTNLLVMVLFLSGVMVYRPRSVGAAR